jgi:Ca-activated chloride channel homolog
VLLEMTAPGRDLGTQRAPSTLQVVLDRSGSMADGRLEAAKDALGTMVARPTTTEFDGRRPKRLVIKVLGQ